MNEYSGPQQDDPTIGNHGYLQDHAHGFECYNFSELNGYCYGYVPRSSGIDINKLGAATKDDEVDGVLVVWIAKNPFNNKTYVVGWYKNAVVYRTVKTDDKECKERGEFSVLDYGVRAKGADCRLVPTTDRTCHVPSRSEGEHGFGQSPLWYADKRPDIKHEVLKYIKDGLAPSRIQPKKQKERRGGDVDPELRKNVEIAAVKVATTYYEERGYRVTSRETECVGWDLDAENALECLGVEVKGLSGDILSVELTANEYEKMKKDYKKYVLFVVTNALTSKNIHIFRYCHARKDWVDQSGNRLSFNERVSATASIS